MPAAWIDALHRAGPYAPTCLMVALAAYGLGALVAFLRPGRRRMDSADVLMAVAALATLLAGVLALAAPEPLLAEVARFGNGSRYRIRIDRLAGVFLTLLGFVTTVVATYAPAHLAELDPQPRGLSRAAKNVLAASLALVFVADGALLWIAAWEGVALSSYLLVVVSLGPAGQRAPKDDARARRAGFVYAITTQIGIAFGMAALLVMARHAGSLDFDAMRVASPHISRSSRGLMLAGSVIAFGAQAGLVPLHLWLRHANPAGPAPAAALMSGIGVLGGAFGAIRFGLDLAGPPSWGWGLAMVVVGAVSVLYGVLYALIERDLQRVVACFSVHSLGLVFIDIGIAAMAVSGGQPRVAALALGAALMQAVAHATAVPLLSLAAGAVRARSGTGSLAALGGVARRMPVTSGMFMLGCASLVGLPPLVGFAGQWASMQTLFQAMRLPGTVSMLILPGVLGTVALAAGVALAVSVRVIGSVFLGRPRSPAAEPGGAERSARVAMSLAALAVVGGGVLAGLVGTVLGRVTASMALGRAFTAPPVGAAGRLMVLSWFGVSLSPLALAGLALAGVLVVAALVRLGSGAAWATRPSPTWVDGAEPGTALQYSPRAHAQPLRHVFRKLLSPTVPVNEPDAGVHEPDTIAGILLEDRLYRPFGRMLTVLARWARRAQSETVHQALTYVFLTLAALIAVVVIAWG